MPVDMKALLAQERERRRRAAAGPGEGGPSGAAAEGSSEGAPPPPSCHLEERTSLDLADFDVGAVANVRGLHYVPDFISVDEERAVLAGIHAPDTQHRWVPSGRRRVANFGGSPSSSLVTEPLPPFAASLLRAITQSGIVNDTTRPNHVLVNEYIAPAGISPHNDGDIYAPHVAIITLSVSALMDFWPNDGTPTIDDDRTDCDENDPVPIAQVMLRPRSLLLYTGDAYGLRHGIRDKGVDSVSDRCANVSAANVTVGEEVARGLTRYSVVFVRKGGLN